MNGIRVIHQAACNRCAWWSKEYDNADDADAAREDHHAENHGA